MFFVYLIVFIQNNLEIKRKVFDAMDTSSDEPSIPNESPKRTASARPSKGSVKGGKDGKSTIKKNSSSRTLLKVDRDSDPAIEDALSMAGTPYKKAKPIPPKLMKEMEEAAAVRKLVLFLSFFPFLYF